MPLDIPKEPKVYTTVYDNFKGVDFTNDATNVWHRRSPDGYNMLPDESGRPFKRTGWEVIVSAEDLCDILNKTDIRILKCHYFELAGKDHILIFTDGGVFRYLDDELKLLTTPDFSGDSTDVDCYTSYDRAFFFEGGGTSAFYIYGNYKVWVYGYDGDFYFKQTDDIYIPTVIFSADASSCTGETLESYNMLGNLAQVLYQDNEMFYSYTDSSYFTFTVDKAKFNAWLFATTFTFTYDLANTKWVKSVNEQGTITTEDVSTTDFQDVYGVTVTGTLSNGDVILFRKLVSETYYTITSTNTLTLTLDSEKVATWLKNPTPFVCPNPNTTFTFTYDYANTKWTLVTDTLGNTQSYSSVDISKYGITILGTPHDGDKIVVKYLFGLLLPSNVTQDQTSDVKVFRSVITQFDDDSMEVEKMLDSSTPPQNVYPSDDTECVLHTDLESYPESDRRAWIEFYSAYPPLVEGEDSLKVIYPVTNVTITNYGNATPQTAEATIVK